MYVSWRWISQWVDTSGVDPVAFAQRFTCTVAEIDKVHRWGQGLKDVRVADVIAVQAHPNADKLRLATVDLGPYGQTTVVCGAPDLRLGMRVPFVPPGTTLPSGIVVRDGEVRGVRSPGMLASEADLGLSDDHAGLLSLDGCTAPAGTHLPDAVALEDVLYEVDNKSITHRPDLWGQYGMAREVAAMLDRPLQPLALDVPTLDAANAGLGDPVQVRVEAPDLCPRYVCARVEGVTVGPAPVDQRLLLRRMGVRPISGVVDATNLVMLETGNPLHAFDARQIRGDQIRVRRAHAGETITTLDGQVRPLVPSDCVIADGQGPVALAGIMGGADSEIRDDTRTVVLEAAAFDAPAIRKTAMRLGMRTESSARFEKALDPALPEVAARRFLRLLLELCPDARLTSRLLDAGPYRQDPPAQRVIVTQGSYLRSRLGVEPQELDDAWMDGCLQRLGFRVDRPQDRGNRDELAVGVPSWRATKDVHHAEDLIEELGRHFGYHRIRSQAPLVAARPPYVPEIKKLERQLRRTLVEHAGLTEVLLYGFDDETARHRLGIHEGDLPRLQLRNAISTELTHLRRSLVPNLVYACEQNLARGDGRQASKKGLQVGLFEVGRAFVPVPDRELTMDEAARVDPGLPDLAFEPAGDPAKQAWMSRMDADMRSAVEQAVARGQVLPWQPMRLGLVLGERLGGGAEGSKTARPPREVSERLFRNLVGTLQAIARAAGVGAVTVRQEDQLDLPALFPELQGSWRHPRRWGLVRAGGVPVGVVGLVHPAVRQRLDVPAEIAWAELDLQALLDAPPRQVKGLAPATLPAATVDVTLRTARTVRTAQVHAWLEQTVRAASAVIEAVEPMYGLDEGDVRALTFRVTCRAPDRSVTQDDVGAVLAAVQVAVANAGFSLQLAGQVGAAGAP